MGTYNIYLLIVSNILLTIVYAEFTGPVDIHFGGKLIEGPDHNGLKWSPAYKNKKSPQYSELEQLVVSRFKRITFDKLKSCTIKDIYEDEGITYANFSCRVDTKNTIVDLNGCMSIDELYYMKFNLALLPNKGDIGIDYITLPYYDDDADVKYWEFGLSGVICTGPLDCEPFSEEYTDNTSMKHKRLNKAVEKYLERAFYTDQPPKTENFKVMKYSIEDYMAIGLTLKFNKTIPERCLPYANARKISEKLNACTNPQPYKRSVHSPKGEYVAERYTEKPKKMKRRKQKE